LAESSNTQLQCQSAVRNAPVAIVGMGCLFPGAQGVRQYWRLLRRGEDQVRDVPSSHWTADDYGCDEPTEADLTYCTRGAFLDPVSFDPTEFGIPPTALESTDTAQLLTLLAAKEALADAGYRDDAEFDRSRVSVILGVTGALELVVPLGARLGHPIWRKALAEAGVDQPLADDVIRRIGDAYVSWKESSFPGLLGNVVAGRIANRLNLHGTNCVVDAACASSLSAVHLAMLELAAGRSDMVLTGGTDTFNDIFMFMCFAKTQALSKSGDARPFDANADGTVIGEGVGVLALKRLDDAVRDGDRVYAVIRGVGTSSDGKSQSIYAPLADGQARALRDAYEVSGVTPGDIELVEAHGTGTKVGDATEFDALCDVYSDASGEPWCALGSVKSQIGHTKAAAGVAGLVKAALALHHKVLPPTIKVTSPNPKLGLADGPFYLNAKPRPWLKRGDAPRAAAVSSFGFGGSNFHAVLSEHGETDDVAWDVGVNLIAFSGTTPADVSAKLSDWRRWVDGSPSLAAMAHRAADSRRGFDVSQPHRVVIVADRLDDLAARIDQAIRLVESGGKSNPSRGVYVSTSRAVGKLAVVFSGQASQYPNMGRDLVCAFPEARRAIELAQRTVALDQPLGSLIYPIPSFDPAVTRGQRATLTRTEIAQPALGAVSLAMWRVLERFGVTPDMAAGHSYGELGALFAAGVIDDQALIRLSGARGAAMASSGDQAGTMLAVSAPLDDIAAMIGEQRLDVVLANRNSPTQGVLSGPVAAIDEAERCCRDRGWSVSRIDVSAAFHSELMTSASQVFRKALESVSISPPQIPVFATQDGRIYPDDAKAVKALLATQMLSPVDFVGQIEQMRDAGATTFVEVGPKRVLTSLVGKILSSDNYVALPMDVARPDECGLTRLAHVLAELAAGGFAVRLDQWNPDCPAPRQQRMTVMLTGANYRADKPRSVAPSPVSPQSVPSRPKAPAHHQPSRGKGDESGKGGIPSANRPTSRQVQQGIKRVSQSEIASTRNTVNTRPSPQSDTTPAENKPREMTPVTEAPQDGRLANVLDTVQEGLRAMQSLQQQTAAAHQRFLEGQELAHKTFERVMEGQHRLMEHLLSGGVNADQAATWPTERERVSPSSQPLHSPALATSASRNVPTSANGNPQVATKADVADATTGNAGGSRFDVERVVIDAISATTGYPVDAIHQGMDLGEDLNLDRVGRVRLLEELQRRSDRFARVGAGDVLQLTRVSQLFSLGNGHAVEERGESDQAPVEVIAAAPAVKVQPVPSEGGAADDAESTLLEVVADLTGYPTEMLDADMDLEADLGIDSIKRVEILATLQERIPQMKAVDSSYIGSLRTLRNIVEYIGGGECGETAVAASAEKKTADALDVDPAAAASDAVSDDVGLPQRRVLRAIELPAIDDAAGRIVRVAAGRELWIAPGDEVLAAALCDHWIGEGVPCRVIDAADPPTDMRRAGGLVVVADRPIEAWSSGDANTTSWLRDVFGLATRLAAPLRSAADAGGAVFATVSRMDGRFGLAGDVLDPIQGALAGLIKTAGHEWPGVICKAIDVDAGWDDSPAIARVVANELADDGPLEIGLTDKCRFGLMLDEASPLAGDLPIGSSDVVLVTGGARGVTAESIVALAEQTRAMFVLWGRSPSPQDEPGWLSGVDDPAQVKQAVIANAFAGQPVTPKQVDAEVRRLLGQREIRQTLERIAQVGGRAVYMPVDVADADAVAAAAGDVVRNHGPIAGLIHGAGVLADRFIADKTVDQFEHVFGVKVNGLANVLSAIDQRALRSLVLFSSVSARFGNCGQSDYAMANEALNKIAGAAAKRLPGCQVVSINWGPFSGGMVTPLLAKQFVQRGVALIEPRAGARMMLAEMRQPPGADVEVVVGDGLMDEPRSGGGAFNDCATARHCDSPAAATDRTTVLRRRVTVSSHPFLGDHVVGGRPVLPVAMMLEWMAHGALHANPGLRLSRIEDFRVLRALAFDADAVALIVDSGKVERIDDRFVAPIELRSDASSDAPHARAAVVLTARLIDAPDLSGKAIDRAAFPLDVDAVYREILFHGPRFRAIESLTAADEQGIAATLRAGPSPEDWMDAPLRSEWIVDPLIVDGVLQLGIVWSYSRLDALSLPSRIARLDVFAASSTGGLGSSELMRVTLNVTRSADHRVTADAVVTDDANRVLMRFTGIEWTVDASLRSSIAPPATAATGHH